MTIEISIHAPRTGSDDPPDESWEWTQPFQSTLPARGATVSPFLRLMGLFHFNPRSPHGERLNAFKPSGFSENISIHAPRTGSDHPLAVLFVSYRYFNPRSPHGERLSRGRLRVLVRAFQSTLPARGATQTSTPRNHFKQYFNPRSPHGERLLDS